MTHIAPPRPLDHLVLAVRDLDAAAAFYRALGFQVGARNRHPWGTETVSYTHLDVYKRQPLVRRRAISPRAEVPALRAAPAVRELHRGGEGAIAAGVRRGGRLEFSTSVDAGLRRGGNLSGR